MIYTRSLILSVMCLFSIYTYADSSTINVISRGDQNAQYALGQLELALSKIGHPYTINTIVENQSSSRVRTETLEGRNDIFWSTTSIELEKEFMPIRIPLYKGLFGYRLNIVESSQADKLGRINTLEDLKQFTFGQGSSWSDTAILRANGLKVIATPKYNALFHMVDGKRFDAFPRGINEPWAEISRRPDLNLVVDSHIMLAYKNPFYLFVNPEKKVLAQRITEAFKASLDDGTFDAYFYDNETVRQVLMQAKAHTRKVFHLENPLLPKETPIDQDRLWVDLVQFSPKPMIESTEFAQMELK